jgi:hypothetical protein
MTETMMDLRARENARSRVIAEAQRGDVPSEFYRESDLRYAFGPDGWEEEIARLDEIAREAQEARREKERRRQKLEGLNREVERVLEEWDAQEKRERHERATVEAKKRIGWTDA